MSTNKISFFRAAFHLLITILTITGMVIHVAPQPVRAQAKSSNLSTPQLINAALQAGKIDQPTANLYLAYALGDYAKLPAEYHSDVRWDGTLPLFNLNQTIKMQGAGVYEDEIIIALDATTCDTSTAALPTSFNSTNFHIDYNTISGGLTINSYATTLETVWAKEITDFNWGKPPVYAANPAPGNRYPVRIDALGGGLYGYVSATGTHAGFVGDNPNTLWDDINAWATCMVLNRDFSALSATPQAALDATAAHEFNHSIQFGYGILGDPGLDSAFIEGSATWMEDEVFDSANDNYQYLWPDFTLSMDNYTASPYAYWITFRGLTERFGHGASGMNSSEQVMQDFWEYFSSSPRNQLESLDAALVDHGTNLADAYHAYAIAVKFNKTCGGSFVYPYCFIEAANYVAKAGATPLQGSIATTNGSFSGSVQDSYTLNWVSLPTSGSYNVTLQNTAADGSLRGSIVCDTGVNLNITPLPAVAGAGASSTFSNYAPNGCASVVAVITNQSTATNGTARSYTLALASQSNPQQRIKNGGFDTYIGASKVPKNWKAVNFALTDGKTTAVKKAGAASVKISGTAGKVKTLTQIIALSGSDGDAFNFSFWAKGTSIPAAGVCRAQVLLYNGTTLKQTKTVNCQIGTYAFKKKTLTFTATSAYTKVVVKFTYSKSKGTAWFDGASLMR